MSCEECERVQEEGDYVIPFRVGAATVMIVACREHAGELIEGYQAGRDGEAADE